jgi:hypothetical protein
MPGSVEYATPVVPLQTLDEPVIVGTDPLTVIFDTVGLTAVHPLMFA